jgi:hypothetical protein
MSYLSHLRCLFAWIAILGMLSLPLATAQAMGFEHGSMTTVMDLSQQDLALTASDTDPCCVTHKAGKTLNDCGKIACVSAVSCMAKCVPGTVALITKAARNVFGAQVAPFDEVTIALYGPEPPLEPPRS